MKTIEEALAWAESWRAMGRKALFVCTCAGIALCGACLVSAWLCRGSRISSLACVALGLFWLVFHLRFGVLERRRMNGRADDFLRRWSRLHSLGERTDWITQEISYEGEGAPLIGDVYLLQTTHTRRACTVLSLDEKEKKVTVAFCPR